MDNKVFNYRKITHTHTHTHTHGNINGASESLKTNYCPQRDQERYPKLWSIIIWKTQRTRMDFSKLNIWVCTPKFSKFARILSNLNLPEGRRILIMRNMCNMNKNSQIQSEISNIKVIDTLEKVKKKKKETEKNY